MNKKSQQTWISAVLYIALGMVVLSIILATGMPVVNKLKDKQTAAQTKNIMHEIDKTIREIYNEGPGSQRVRTIEVGKGDFTILKNMINWVLDTKYIESTPGLEVKEGNLNITTASTAIVGNYNLILSLYYPEFTLDISKLQTKVFKGRTQLIFRNAGVPSSCTTDCKLQIQISEV